jgi:3-dehydroquinate synthase
MQSLSTLSRPVHFGSLIESDLTIRLTKEIASTKVMILVDENTHRDCIPFLSTYIGGLESAEIIEIPAGEESKTMETCQQIWQTLTEHEFSRHDILICLGGGMITDLGGFVAGIYKRGMRFINIPTSLLGMVDAAIGGKTGVDFGPYKNQLGLFNLPEATYIDPTFLETLPEEEWRCGLAEMIKHGLISNATHLNKLIEAIASNQYGSAEMILESFAIKNALVEADPTEKGKRKLLNFGHTVGHAIEGYCLEIGDPIPHGMAVAHGIYVESYMSYKIGLISERQYEQVASIIEDNFILRSFSVDCIPIWMKLMKNDKKNKDQKILFVLLKGIGSAVYDKHVDSKEIKNALKLLCD